MIRPMKFLATLWLFSLLFLACQSPEPIDSKDLSQIIPKPQITYPSAGKHLVGKDISWSIPESFDLTKRFLEEYLTPHGFFLAAVNPKDQDASPLWAFSIDTNLTQGAYHLEIQKERLSVRAADDLGGFYAAQSLRQLMPEYLEQQNRDHRPFYLPAGLIKDRPKFAYRGMHLDVGRHFFGPDEIKKYIDYLALLKMNYFHWHLTEDQGWRIEIKSFPKLTEHGSVRKETLVGHYSDEPHQFDGTPYGGFYTQEEVKDIVAYAAQRHITVIPEIEMPGHAQAAISAYPELGCTNQAIDVATKWGIFEDIYCAQDETFVFLETVLEEVIDLFPGPYIHIGGDEAPKTHWSSCASCQNVIQENNLADEHELQSYFITRIESFINSKGKQIIGWDEILEGGLAPNATVMSWRGTQGGIEAAKQGHNVIMTPTSHCYFDYYQSESPEEPLAIGGYLPLKKVYSYNPIPHELSPQEADYVLGAQGNVWTEYMPNFEQVQYMVFPRILALSEVVWQGPSRSLDRDYAGFTRRVGSFFKRLDAMQVNYANHLYDIASIHRVESSPAAGDQSQQYIAYALINPFEELDMEYRLNNDPWGPYNGPVRIDKNSGIQARLLRQGTPVGHVMSDSLIFHPALGSVSSVVPAPHSSYNAGGIPALTNGKRGDDHRYGDSEWLGFWGQDVDIQLDLKQTAQAKTLGMRFYHSPGQWIYTPKSVQAKLTYGDGSTRTLELSVSSPDKNGPHAQHWALPAQPDTPLKSCTLTVVHYGVIPSGKQGAGQPSWTFIDEIILEP